VRGEEGGEGKGGGTHLRVHQIVKGAQSLATAQCLLPLPRLLGHPEPCLQGCAQIRTDPQPDHFADTESKLWSLWTCLLEESNNLVCLTEVGGSTPGLSHGDLGIFLGGGQTEEFVH